MLQKRELKVFFYSFKGLYKSCSFEGVPCVGPSGRLAGRLEKCIFLLKFFLKRAHFRASVWGGSSGWPAGATR